MNLRSEPLAVAARPIRGVIRLVAAAADALVPRKVRREILGASRETGPSVEQEVRIAHEHREQAGPRRLDVARGVVELLPQVEVRLDLLAIGQHAPAEEAQVELLD